MSSLTITAISIILTSIWHFNRSDKLRKTKDIKKYIWPYHRNIKDIDGYINFYSKMYFSEGVFLITLGIFIILNECYFDLSISILMILFFIFFILILIASTIIEKKIKKFL